VANEWPVANEESRTSGKPEAAMMEAEAVTAKTSATEAAGESKAV
jgi:hypothetical protein